MNNIAGFSQRDFRSLIALASGEGKRLRQHYKELKGLQQQRKIFIAAAAAILRSPSSIYCQILTKSTHFHYQDAMSHYSLSESHK